MFQTFTGSSRRPRNVNLSGRNTNPFAAAQAANARLGGAHPPSSSSTPTTSSPNAVAHAQQERRARQVEREKTQAAKTVQRVWKGYAARKRLASELRDEWDKGASASLGAVSAADTDWDWELDRLKMLVRFADRKDGGDVRRVCLFEGWMRKRARGLGQREDWARPLGNLLRWVLRALPGLPREIQSGEREGALRSLTGLLQVIGHGFPSVVARQSREYYRVLGEALVKGILEDPREHGVQLLVLLPMRDPVAYEGFVLEFMTTPELGRYLDLEGLAKTIDLDQLTRATRRLVDTRADSRHKNAMPKSKMLWLLAYFVLFHHASSSSRIKSNLNIAFTATVCSLLSYLSDILSQRPNIHNTQPQSDVPAFVRAQVETLISLDNIQSLLSSSQLLASGSTSDARSEDAAILASYALTLLQVFPRRGDDIRMWLYMGSMSKPDQGSPEPSIKYFWKAVRGTKIYQDIHDDPKKAIQRLNSSRQGNSNSSMDSAESDWQKILLFLELYGFVLQVMDDEQFMTGAAKSNSSQSWTGRSALAISDVIHLTIFLKHFAFAMYWHSSQIAESNESVDSTRIASYFGHASAQARLKEAAAETQSSEEVGFAGISGMTLSYMKGMVTGLLRMLYERDSRRNFTRNKDHWLMKEFHIEGFISAVVDEQAVKSEHQDDDSDDDMMEEDDSEDDRIQPVLVGTHRTQHIRRMERLKRQQHRETRRKQLQTVTPRLEILQNMPFFIPFATRVEIFREFVHNDQLTRREGFIDPDQWRMALQHRAFQSNPARARNELSKHMAKVRRDHIFEDAFEQFYELGEGLKEPIQITFVDQFDTPEAGIDGGGVTKEFLTSVTSEAFTPDNDFNLFVENSQHLLYPNPSALDEKRELLRETGVIREGSQEWNEQIRGLIKRYEFLGRVVGKCLYEGILVDIHFAPFFLVKWALTGGSGSATNESGYRANINDLRDLDEELYQGLLKLKNYPGNVEDFALDFTVTDPITSGAHPKLITRDLRPGGSSTPVTNQNRLIYVSSVARHRLQVQPFAQTQAFLRGLSSIIQPSWLSMFNQSELQTLLGGDAAEIDVDDLRAHTMYGGVYALGDDGLEHPTVQDFWAVMKGLSDADRRKVLKYVTSTPRGPLLGFGQLNPRFSIRDSGGDQSRLPSTSTCVNLLKLPIYRDPGVLREKLLYAVNSGAGFNLS